MKSKLILLILPLAYLVAGCEDVVDIKPKKNDAQLVIEGLIVPDSGKSYIKLSETTPYFSDSFSKAKKGANVIVKDNFGVGVSFAETTEGYYEAPSDFIGKVGVLYTLQVSIDNKEITAESTMPSPIEVDDIRVIYAADGDPELQKGYYLYGTFSDEKNIRNYFRAEVYVNGVRQLQRANDIVVFEDRFFENQENVEGQFRYWANAKDDFYKIKPGDEISMRLYSIDYTSYSFLKALNETPTQGGLFGKNPANVPSNVSGALGIFQACSYTSSEKIIVTDN